MRPATFAASLNMMLNILPLPRLIAFQNNILTPVVLKGGTASESSSELLQIQISGHTADLMSQNL